MLPELYFGAREDLSENKGASLPENSSFGPFRGLSWFSEFLPAQSQRKRKACEKSASIRENPRFLPSLPERNRPANPRLDRKQKKRPRPARLSMHPRVPTPSHARRHRPAGMQIASPPTPSCSKTSRLTARNSTNLRAMIEHDQGLKRVDDHWTSPRRSFHRWSLPLSASRNTGAFFHQLGVERGLLPPTAAQRKSTLLAHCEGLSRWPVSAKGYSWRSEVPERRRPGPSTARPQGKTPSNTAKSTATKPKHLGKNTSTSINRSTVTGIFHFED